MIQQLTWIAAFVFIAVGVMGFVSGIFSESSLLFGTFEVGVTLAFLYVAFGLMALGAVATSSRLAIRFFQLLGIVATVATVLGFIRGDVLGLFSVNVAVNVLHTIVAVCALWVGFGMEHDEAAGG